MKLRILLGCLIALTLGLWFGGVVSDGVALLTMGAGVGILFWLSENETT